MHENEQSPDYTITIATDYRKLLDVWTSRVFNPRRWTGSSAFIRFEGFMSSFLNSQSKRTILAKISESLFFRSYTSKEIHSLIKPHNYITVLIFFSLKKELLKNRGTALLIIGTKFRNSDSANIFQELDLLRFIDMPKYLWRIWVIDFPKST